jgi:signal transduction histidine kinase
VAELQPSTERHDIEIQAPTEPTLGEWDRARLERVVSNLVSNAIKFSPEGGQVSLTVHRDDRDGQPWVALEVHDQGVGIPPDDLPHIFERFYRASNVAGAIEGTGLGLTGSRHIVEQHGGQLMVESRQGQGSVFRLMLPTSVSAPEEDAHPRQIQAVAAGAP